MISRNEWIYVSKIFMTNKIWRRPNRELKPVLNMGKNLNESVPYWISTNTEIVNKWKPVVKVKNKPENIKTGLRNRNWKHYFQKLIFEIKKSKPTVEIETVIRNRKSSITAILNVWSVTPLKSATITSSFHDAICLLVII